MLGCFWLFALFLSRVGRCFTQMQGEVNSAPIYLAAIFSLSRVQLFWDSLSFLDFLKVYFLCQIRDVLLHCVFQISFQFLGLPLLLLAPL